jgi:hypothetical protein
MSENKQENRQASPVEIYNGNDAQQKRLAIRKEINGTPRPNFSHTFEKTDEERGILWTLRNAWRKALQAKGVGKRKFKTTIHIKL